MLDDNNNPIDQEIVEPIVKKKNLTLSNIFRYILRLIKKYKKTTAAIVFLITILIILFNIIPVISINDVKLVNINSTVMIKMGETVKLKDNSVSVVVKNFTNDICPAEKTCFGSGRSIQAVQYELTIDGKKYATGSSVEAPGTKYLIKTASSDYSTFAEIEIIKR